MEKEKLEDIILLLEKKYEDLYKEILELDSVIIKLKTYIYDEVINGK